MSYRSSCATPIRQNQIRFYVIVLTTLCLLPASATAQTFKVIHSFTGGDDGAYPYAGLTLDKQGNLYGTTNHGGVGDCFPDNFGCGTVYKLTRTQSGWNFQTLYEFTGTPDGGGPYGPVTLGPDGSLYGSTVGGGESTGCPSGCGAVYSLTPPNWTEKVLYSFEGGTDAFFPTGPVTFDSSGNLYGTTYIGGAVGPGAIWKLSPSNGSWAESLPWSFTGTADGGNPYQGVTIDSAGNIYCTAIAGGMNNGGAAIELVPQKSGYAETNVHDFMGGAEGFLPEASLFPIKPGELIGATAYDGAHGGGTIYRLTSNQNAWNVRTLYSLPQGVGPYAKLILDRQGTLYGATEDGPGTSHGMVFKLTLTNQGLKGTLLHRFTGGADGSNPVGSLVVDSQGNIYGTTSAGGDANYGVIFEITP